VKKRILSSSLATEKILFFLLLAALLIFSLQHYPELLWIAAPVFLYFDFMLYYRPVQIGFESDKLFIKRKNGEETVLLKDIHLIKKTGFGIGHKSIWKIRYRVHNGEGMAYFYPRNISSNFSDFIKLVQAANPAAEIKNFK